MNQSTNTRAVSLYEVSEKKPKCIGAQHMPNIIYLFIHLFLFIFKTHADPHSRGVLYRDTTFRPTNPLSRPCFSIGLCPGGYIFQGLLVVPTCAAQVGTNMHHTHRRDTHLRLSGNIVLMEMQASGHEIPLVDHPSKQGPNPNNKGVNVLYASSRP